MKRLEKDIENAVLQYLAMVPGFIAWKVNTGGIYKESAGTFIKRNTGARTKGVSDIIGFYNNRFWAIEVKTPQRRKEVTDEQRTFLDASRLNGQVGIVITSVEEMIEVLEEHDEQKR